MSTINYPIMTEFFGNANTINKKCQSFTYRMLNLDGTTYNGQPYCILSGLNLACDSLGKEGSISFKIEATNAATGKPAGQINIQEINMQFIHPQTLCASQVITAKYPVSKTAFEVVY